MKIVTSESKFGILGEIWDIWGHFWLCPPPPRPCFCRLESLSATPCRSSTTPPRVSISNADFFSPKNPFFCPKIRLFLAFLPLRFLATRAQAPQAALGRVAMATAQREGAGPVPASLQPISARLSSTNPRRRHFEASQPISAAMI